MLFLFVNKIFNSSNELNWLQYGSHFVFCPQGMWGLSPPSRNQTPIHALEGNTLTTGPPGESLLFLSETPQFSIVCHITFHLFIHQFMGILVVSTCWSEVKVAQWCLTLCDPMDCRVHGILQARKLERVAFPFSRGSSQARDWTQVSHTAGGFSTSWATREALPLGHYQ